MIRQITLAAWIVTAVLAVSTAKATRAQSLPYLFDSFETNVDHFAEAGVVLSQSTTGVTKGASSIQVNAPGNEFYFQNGLGVGFARPTGGPTGWGMLASLGVINADITVPADSGPITVHPVLGGSVGGFFEGPNFTLQAGQTTTVKWNAGGQWANSNGGNPIPPWGDYGYIQWILFINSPRTIYLDNIRFTLRPIRGDFFRDGLVDANDVPAMLTAMTDLNAYQTTNTLSPDELLQIGDLDGDLAVTDADIQGLLDYLISTNPAPALVPEPASIVLLSLALPALVFLARRRRICRLP